MIVCLFYLGAENSSASSLQLPEFHLRSAQMTLPACQPARLISLRPPPRTLWILMNSVTPRPLPPLSLHFGLDTKIWHNKKYDKKWLVGHSLNQSILILYGFILIQKLIHTFFVKRKTKIAQKSLWRALLLVRDRSVLFYCSFQLFAIFDSLSSWTSWKFLSCHMQDVSTTLPDARASWCITSPVRPKKGPSSYGAKMWR